MNLCWRKILVSPVFTFFFCRSFSYIQVILKWTLANKSIHNIISENFLQRKGPIECGWGYDNQNAFKKFLNRPEFSLFCFAHPLSLFLSLVTCLGLFQLSLSLFTSLCLYLCICLCSPDFVFVHLTLSCFTCLCQNGRLLFWLFPAGFSQSALESQSLWNWKSEWWLIFIFIAFNIYIFCLFFKTIVRSSSV